MKMGIVTGALAITLVVAACTSRDQIGSVTGGECRISSTPEYEVLGKTAYDQVWINRTVEALVDGCGQARPKARPKELDGKVKQKPAVKAPGKKKPAGKEKLKQLLSKKAAAGSAGEE